MPDGKHHAHQVMPYLLCGEAATEDDRRFASAGPLVGPDGRLWSVVVEYLETQSTSSKYLALNSRVVRSLSA